MIKGNNWSDFFQGASVMALMNLMRFDAMVPGNHEFDYGLAVLRQRLQEARFPVVAANVKGLAEVKPYVIKELAGLKIALLGLLTPETPIITHPRNTAGLQFLPPAAVVKEYLPQLRQKADLVVVLSHLGYPEDRELAAQVPGLDLIVGGHSHTKLLEPVQVNSTVIVQAWEHGKALGVVDLTVKDGKIVGATGRLEEVKPQAGWAEATAVKELVAKYQGQLDAVLNVVVGKTLLDLEGGKGAPSRETNFGDLVADVLRESSGAEAALINRGTIRKGIKQGDIRKKDLYAALPFDNFPVVLKLSGRQLRAALEYGLAAGEQDLRKFPQVAGMTVVYNRNAPAGNKIKEILVNGWPLAPEGQYTVATHDFLAAGGDGYQMLREAVGGAQEPYAMAKSPQVVYVDQGAWLRDLVGEYIEKQKVIEPKEAGRLKEEGS
jgi:2',3'-cyclic-nucleotide 2'-phosphodiesterase (5'-nucleotidase family)